MSWGTEWGTVILGASVLGSTIWHNWRQSKLANDRMSKELFTEFNTRYSILNGSLEKVITYKTVQELLDSKDKQCLDDVYDFFDLCAEEYYWYGKKRINKEIWLCWYTAMNRWYNDHAIIQEAWQLQINDFGKQAFYIKKSDNGFFKN